jgi:ADP-heptose:LPS heptosyltransferase
MTAPPHVNPQRILIIVYGHVADTIAAIPGLRSLRREYPLARLDVLVVSGAAPILSNCPYVDEVLVWNDLQRKGMSFARAEKLAATAALVMRIRRRRYSAVIVFHRSFGFMRRLAAASGAAIVAGMSDGGDGYTHQAARSVQPESSRDENRRVLEAFGVQEDGQPIELWTSADDESAADRLIELGGSGPLIGLHPGSDWSCQQWLPQAFSAVGRSLQLTLGANLVITGSAGEVSLQEEIAHGLLQPAMRAAGRTTLNELVALVRRMDLLISVNSSAAAIARAVGTPTVVLLGPEDARFTGLEPGVHQQMVQSEIPQEGGSWCEFGRWGILSSCESPMCRGLGGLADVHPDRVFHDAITLLDYQVPGAHAIQQIAQEIAT